MNQALTSVESLFIAPPPEPEEKQNDMEQQRELARAELKAKAECEKALKNSKFTKLVDWAVNIDEPEKVGVYVYQQLLKIQGGISND